MSEVPMAPAAAPAWKRGPRRAVLRWLIEDSVDRGRAAGQMPLRQLSERDPEPVVNGFFGGHFVMATA